MDSFHFSKLIFNLRYQDSGYVPEYKTSAIRGGMGQMLLRMFCVCPDKQEIECDNCLCHSRCIVQSIMYSSFKLKPDYVTDKESAGFFLYCDDEREYAEFDDEFSFEIILYGDMVSYFYPIFQAVHMLGMEGLGRKRIPFSVESVKNSRGDAIVDGPNICYDRVCIENSSDYVRERVSELKLENEHNDIRICFDAPCEIKYHGEKLSRFAPEGVIAAVDRRVRMRCMFEGVEPVDIEYEIPDKYREESRSQIIKRHSGRQEDDIKLKGISGWLDLYGVQKDLIDVLIMGELTGVGKNTKFGFGKYRIEKMTS